MRSVTSVLWAGVAVAMLAWVSPARADQWDQATYFTFSAPVQLPGVTLPAGTYMFKHADSLSDRHIVQVFSKDGATIYATILAIPDTRLTASDKPIVTFEETPAGVPEAIKAWFYPGDTIGDEFVYPRDQALRIASATHQPVLATARALPAAKTPSLTAARNASVSRVNENGQAEALHSDQAARVAQMKSLATTDTGKGVATSGRTEATAAPPAAAASGQSRSHRSRAKHLPTTASDLPAVALASLCLLGLGMGVRVIRKRVA